MCIFLLFQCLLLKFQLILFPVFILNHCGTPLFWWSFLPNFNLYVSPLWPVISISFVYLCMFIGLFSKAFVLFLFFLFWDLFLAGFCVIGFFVFCKFVLFSCGFVSFILGNLYGIYSENVPNFITKKWKNKKQKENWITHFWIKRGFLMIKMCYS